MVLHQFLIYLLLFHLYNYSFMYKIVCSRLNHKTMILKGYPDYTKPGFDVNSPCLEIETGWPNMVIYNRTKTAYYPLHTGPLTLKFTLKGEEYFATKQRNY